MLLKNRMVPTPTTTKRPEVESADGTDAKRKALALFQKSIVLADGGWMRMHMHIQDFIQKHWNDLAFFQEEFQFRLWVILSDSFISKVAKPAKLKWGPGRAIKPDSLIKWFRDGWWIKKVRLAETRKTNLPCHFNDFFFLVCLAPGSDFWLCGNPNNGGTSLIKKKRKERTNEEMIKHIYFHLSAR